MAKTRKGRPINGILLVNKPLHWTSNQVVQKVKWLFNAQKAGHTGALDPLATGMLPVCLGEATKFSQYLLDADKCYEVTACLGVRTTTSDADGEVVSTATVDVSEDKLRATVDTFKGPQQQVPSMFSALKHEGRPLYYYARKGIDIPRPARSIYLYELIITHLELPYVTLFVRCSKGTYIRTLVDDIGQALGCGAYVTRLHRPSLGQYQGQPMFELPGLEAQAPAEKTLESQAYASLDSLLLPMDAAISHLPSISLTAEQANVFCRGGSVPLIETATLLTSGASFRVYCHQDADVRFMGVGECITAPIDQPLKQRESGWFLGPRRVVVYSD